MLNQRQEALIRLCGEVMRAQAIPDAAAAMREAMRGVAVMFGEVVL
jgi:hypothetical protein